MKRFLGAIYDFDDTLLDNYPKALAPYNIHELSRAQAGWAIGKELGIQALIDTTYEQHLQAFLDASEHTVEGAVWQLLCMLELEKGELNRNHPIVCEVVRRKQVLYEELYQEYCMPVGGAVACVRKFHELSRPQAIASGAFREHIDTFTQKYELQEIFDRQKILAKGDYEKSKPHPESFEKAFLALGLPNTSDVRARVVAFEDDPKGVESAKRAGLYVCAVMTRFDEKSFVRNPYKPDVVVTDFDAFMSL